MSADPNAYRELNEHHANLDAERRTGPHVPEPLQLVREADGLELSPEQKRRTEIAMQRDQQWREEFGEEAVRPSSYLTEEQRILAKGKDRETERQDLNELYQREKRLEQSRLATVHFVEARTGEQNRGDAASRCDPQSPHAQNEEEERQAKVDARVKQYQAYHSQHQRDGERER